MDLQEMAALAAKSAAQPAAPAPEVTDNVEQPTDNGTVEAPAPVETENQNTVDIAQEVSNAASESKPVSAFANEQLAEANAYLLKNPDKNIEDYNALKVPTSEINEDELLKSYLSGKEGMTKSEVAYEMKKMERALADVDSEFMDEDDLDLETLKVKAEREKMLEKAKAWRDEYVKDQLTFETAEPQAEQQPQGDIQQFLKNAEEAQKRYRDEYVASIYSAIPEITSVPVTVNGQEILFTPDEAFAREMKAGAEDPASIGKQFFDDNGKITNPKGFITETTLWANPSTRQRLLDFAIEQAVTRDRAERNKVQRNVTLDNYNGSPTPSGESNEKQAVDLFLRQSHSKSF